LNCLIVGCGYLGQQAASLLIAQGVRVFAITRSQGKAEELARQSIQPIVANWYQRNDWPTLPQIDQLIVSVSHAPVANIPPTETHASGLANLFEQLATPPDRVAYLSTTGVYAACDDGRWIDETSPVGPNRPGSIAALTAEKWLAEHLPQEHLVILRAAGIYGPGRIPRLDKLRAQEPIEVDPDSYLNLVHVDDLAQIVIELMNQKSACGIYNVSDGRPALRRDYYEFISKTIGSAAPTFRTLMPIQEETGSTIRRSRGEGNKRIANEHMMEALQYRFRFPDYIAGLSPLL